jgi:hypothetical protein
MLKKSDHKNNNLRLELQGNNMEVQKLLTQIKEVNLQALFSLKYL